MFSTTFYEEECCGEHQNWFLLPFSLLYRKGLKEEEKGQQCYDIDMRCPFTTLCPCLHGRREQG